MAPPSVMVEGVASPPEDDRILASALSGQADCLVTGDARLQELIACRDLVILSQRAFLDAFG
jgi:predicted nucleic acid-binding protein